MAIARPGSIVAAISGTIAGTTFTNARAGLVVGHRRRWTDPSSTPALTRRAQLARLAAVWRALSEDQRLTWNRAAETAAASNRLGQRIKRSGFRWFLAANAVGNIKDLPLFEDPPILASSPSILSASWVVTDAPSAVVSAVLPAYGAASTLFLYGSSTPIGVDARAWRTWRYLTYLTEDNLPFDVASQWTALLGTIQADRILGLRLRRVVGNYMPSTFRQVYATVT